MLFRRGRKFFKAAYRPNKIEGTFAKLGRPMKFEITDEIQKRAIYCTKEFNCLKDDKQRVCPLCPVAECIEGKTHYIKCLGNNDCHYRASIHRLYFKCTCPVRMEVYNKYQI